MFAFLSVFLLFAVTDIRGRYFALLKRPVLPECKSFAAILCVFVVLLFLLALVVLVLFSTKVPTDSWIGRITFCAVPAAISSFVLLFCTHADAIEQRRKRKSPEEFPGIVLYIRGAYPG